MTNNDIRTANTDEIEAQNVPPLPTSDQVAESNFVKSEAGEQHDGETEKSNKKLKFWLRISSGVLLTATLVLVGYLFWQFVWTGMQADSAQNELINSQNWTYEPEEVAEREKGEPPSLPTPTREGEMMGVVYVSAFGKEYYRTLVEGTDRSVLDLYGFGHFRSTVMPGEIGNFAAAAHRNGYGAPMQNAPLMVEGTNIMIRTRDYWYVYKVTGSEIVTPESSDVLFPVPHEPETIPTKRLLTFTTCHPEYSDAERWIVYAEFDYWAKTENGVPKELKDL
ncbi:MAG: class E sortase [Bifidobacteriaceae bacterium]|jgi:sortase (surface protein transpeptidase)|nr:class E sortase [Bifidobacteriaceae bacterium]